MEVVTRRVLLAALLLAPAPLWADPLTVPDKVSGDPGDFVTIKATTSADVKAGVKWLPLDKGLKLFPVDLLRDTRTAVVIGTQPGSYRLLAYTATADGQPTDPVVCVVTINGPTPPPVPPAPPAPPAPPDPFAQAVRDAYAQEADPQKAAYAAQMAGIFRVAPAALDTRPDVKTTADLFAWLKNGLAAVLPKNVVPKVEAAVAAEMAAAFGAPSPQAALDRVQAKAELARIAAALDALGKGK